MSPRWGILAVFSFLATSSDAAAKAPRRTAKSRPPIAFYVADYAVKEPTRERAVARCKEVRAKELHDNPEVRADWPKTCDDEVMAVRGPYKRSPKTSDPYDDPKVYVYRGSNGGWLDAQGSSPCFVAGTAIATAHGDVAIESIHQGDVVLSWDMNAHTITSGLVEHTKIRVAPRVETIRTADGRSVTGTPNHPFFSVRENAWVELGRLSANDFLFALSNASLAETRITTKDVPAITAGTSGFTVYDLTVAPQRNYFAGGVLVHNY